METQNADEAAKYPVAGTTWRHLAATPAVAPPHRGDCPAKLTNSMKPKSRNINQPVGIGASIAAADDAF